MIGDSVNPWKLTRDAWRDAGLRAGAQVLEVEVVCPDPAEHRRRVETRQVPVPGLVLPRWQSVIDRDYHPWDREILRLDTAAHGLADCVAQVRATLGR